MHPYDKACKSAADAQGITKMVEELAAQGITATVWPAVIDRRRMLACGDRPSQPLACGDRPSQDAGLR